MNEMPRYSGRHPLVYVFRGGGSVFGPLLATPPILAALVDVVAISTPPGAMVVDRGNAPPRLVWSPPWGTVESSAGEVIAMAMEQWQGFAFHTRPWWAPGPSLRGRRRAY